MSLFYLHGIDEIAGWIGFNGAEIMDWIVHCEFPAKKVDGIWIAKKKAVKIWLKRFKPPRPVNQLTIREQNKTIKRRRW